MSVMPMSRSQAHGGLDVVTLRLGQDTLAIRAQVLREVLEPVAVTRVPGASGFCGGLVNVRGTVVPLADLRVPLGMPLDPLGPDARVLVLDLPLGGQPAVVGIVADAVHEVMRIEGDSVQAVPSVGTNWPPHMVEGVANLGGSVVMIPDLPAIFEANLAGLAGARHNASGSTPKAQQRPD
jgi:purine-binding chemotaxis protein CheW